MAITDIKIWNLPNGHTTRDHKIYEREWDRLITHVRSKGWIVVGVDPMIKFKESDRTEHVNQITPRLYAKLTGYQLA